MNCRSKKVVPMVKELFDLKNNSTGKFLLRSNVSVAITIVVMAYYIDKKRLTIGSLVSFINVNLFLSDSSIRNMLKILKEEELINICFLNNKTKVIHPTKKMIEFNQTILKINGLEN
jgi:hypothetical protein